MSDSVATAAVLYEMFDELPLLYEMLLVSSLDVV